MTEASQEANVLTPGASALKDVNAAIGSTFAGQLIVKLFQHLQGDFQRMAKKAAWFVVVMIGACG
jgi:hypothetical protein